MTTPAEIRNDSCSIGEPEYSIANGSVGATANLREIIRSFVIAPV